MTKEKEEQLKSEHPHLFRYLKDRQKNLPIARGIECYDGWYDVIHAACITIKMAIQGNEEPHFTQVKEKFGALRIYADTSGLNESQRQAVWAALEMAEQFSTKVCEVCGSTTNVVMGSSSQSMWIKAMCNKCRENRTREIHNEEV